jgi:hypothetical protein
VIAAASTAHVPVIVASVYGHCRIAPAASIVMKAPIGFFLA